MHIIKTAQKPCTLQMDITAPKGKTNIYLEGIDTRKPKTVFFRRNKLVYKKSVLQVNMPLSPQHLRLKVKADAPVKVVLSLKPLPAHQAVEISEATADFIDFATEFALHASYIEDDTVFTNEIGEFYLAYLPRIFSAEGEEITGPAKVNRGTGHITVNSTLFREFTVFMRVFVLLHEWFHYHENSGNEVLVDTHALQVYLSLGFPKLEVMNVTAGLFEDKKGLLVRVERILAYLKNYQASPTCNLKQACV